jgi:hypothetical protein
LYWLGVQGVKVLVLLGVFFLPSVAPASQQDFWFMELTLSVWSILDPPQQCFLMDVILNWVLYNTGTICRS